jgi:hypothetical protein
MVKTSIYLATAIGCGILSMTLSLLSIGMSTRSLIDKKTLAKQQHEQNEYTDGVFRELGMSEKILKCVN